jgi:hypothetical protein
MRRFPPFRHVPGTRTTYRVSKSAKTLVLSSFINGQAVRPDVNEMRFTLFDRPDTKLALDHQRVISTCETCAEVSRHRALDRHHTCVAT